MRRAEGFTLIEAVCVLSIIGLVAAIALPQTPRATTRTRLTGYAVAIAALLKADRNAAIRTHALVSTSLSAVKRSVRSGADGGTIVLPEDVAFDAILAESCAGRAEGTAIDFFPSGMSCGGTIALARPGASYQIRVNWLTGGVELVPIDKS